MLSDLLFRLRALFRRDAMEAEMDEELRSHFENQVEKLVASGMPRNEAVWRARLEFGGYEQLKEECRDARGVSLVETIVQDMRYALRMLRSSPGFTAVAILTLALGIGANTAIFSVIDSVLLGPLPYQDPAGLVVVWENDSQHPNPHNTVSPPDFLDWQRRNSVFSEMAALFDQRANLTGNGAPQEVVLQDVSANFFSVLGVSPILGPGFTAENGKPGHDDVLSVTAFGRSASPAIPESLARRSS
jgi:putative ABC transport system permease protein